jgi:hypothetical protein
MLMLWLLPQPRCGWALAVAPLPCVLQQLPAVAVVVLLLQLPVAALVLLLGRTVRLAGL